MAIFNSYFDITRGYVHPIDIPSIPPDPKERGQRCAEDIQPKHATLLADAVGVQGRQIDAQKIRHACGDVVLQAGDHARDIIYLFIYWFIYVLIYLCIDLFIYLCIYLFIYLFICLFIYYYCYWLFLLYPDSDACIYIYVCIIYICIYIHNM